MHLPGRYFVYIIQCSDNSYYIGVTNDLDRRISEHNIGINESCYTYIRRPVVLQYSEIFMQIEQAIGREKQLKQWSKRKKEALIKGDFAALSKYAAGKKPDQ